jgi:hypothetical protein
VLSVVFLYGVLSGVSFDWLSHVFKMSGEYLSRLCFSYLQKQPEDEPLVHVCRHPLESRLTFHTVSYTYAQAHVCHRVFFVVVLSVVCYK